MSRFCYPCGNSIIEVIGNIWMMRRFVKIVFEIFGILLCGILIFSIALAWRLNSGPISLGFIKPQLVKALTSGDQSYKLEIGEPVFQWRGWNTNIFDVTLKETQLTSDSLGLSLNSPQIIMGLHAPDLLRMKLTANHITLIKTKIDVNHDISPIKFHKNANALITDAVKSAFFSSENIQHFSKIKSIEFRNSEISLYEKTFNSLLELKEFNANVSKTDTGMEINLRSKLDSTTNDSHFSLSLQRRKTQNEITGEGEFKNIPTTVVKEFIPVLKQGIGIETGLTGTLKFSWDPHNHRTHFSTLINALNGKIYHKDLFFNPVIFEKLNAGITYDTDQPSPINGKLNIEANQLNFSATINYDVHTDKNIGTLKVSAPALTIQDIKRLWPKPYAPKVQQWISNNIIHGTLSDLTLNIKGSSDIDDLLEFDVLESVADFKFNDLKAHFFKPSTAAIEMSGSAHFSNNKLSIQLKNGFMHDVNLGGSALKIYPDDTNDYQADVDLMAKGSVKSLRQILQDKTIAEIENIDSIPQGLTGTTTLRAKFSFPLDMENTTKVIPFNASAKIKNATLPDILIGNDFNNGELKINVDQDKIVISGTSILNGDTFTFKQKKLFSSHEKNLGTKEFSLNLTPSDLKKLGLTIPLELDGIISVEAKIESLSEGVSKVNAVVDLINAQISIPQLNWEKPTGSAGRLHLEADIRNNKLIRMNTINLVAADLSLDAQAYFDKRSSRLHKIIINNLSIGDSKIRGIIQPKNKDHYHATLRGKNINLNQFIAKNNAYQNSAETIVSVSANFDQVFLWELPSIKNVTFAMKSDSSSTIQMTGYVDQRAVNIKSWKQNKIRKFTFKSDSAGRILKGFDITDSVIGGEIFIAGEILDNNNVEKTTTQISIKDFGLKDAPLFTQILSSASLIGLLDALRGKGIQFEHLKAEATFTDEKIIITDSLAYGASLGVSATGTIMREDKKASITGMMVPAYGLNRLIDKIPILGRILTGGEKEGLLAAEYFISKSLEDPLVTVNPLTALTPGFLRTFIKATSKSLQ